MERTEPIYLSENDITNGKLYGEVRMYPINKEQFELLIKGQSRCKEYSGKFVYHNGKPGSDVERISNIDLYIIAICAAVAIILFVIDRFVKSSRKTLISKIRAKFEEKGYE